MKTTKANSTQIKKSKKNNTAKKPATTKRVKINTKTPIPPKHILGFIASDHRGFQLKEALKAKFPLIDLGPFSENSVDFPDYAKKLCPLVLEEKSFGILICGSGVGMSIAANRYKGIRATLARDSITAEMGRVHNNSNVLVFGSDFTSPKEAIKIAEAFFKAQFDGQEKRVKRLQKLDV